MVATIALLGSALPATAGAVRFKEYKQVHRTARVSYYAAKRSSVDVKRTEAFLDRLVALFGPAPEGWHISYYRHDSPHVVHPEIGLPAYGVTDLESLRIDSVHAYHPHELVHAVTGRLGRAPILFAEGLAVALTSEGSWRGRDLDQAALAALRSSRGVTPFLERFPEQDADAAYAVAGSLVGYLLDRHGIEPLVAFLRGCGVDSPRHEAAFQRAYGRTLARATIEWERSLREQPGSAREWYDPASWPRSLQRDRAPVAAGPQVASVVAAATMAEQVAGVPATAATESPSSPASPGLDSPAPQ